MRRDNPTIEKGCDYTDLESSKCLIPFVYLLNITNAIGQSRFFIK